MVSKNNTLKMLKRLFPLTLFVLMATLVFAQNPRPIKVSPVDPNQPESVLACAPGFGNEAGTKTLGAFVGASNDTDLDTIYLCMNDQIFIDHDAGSASFAGDPSPTSPGGIGYAVYDCLPTGAFNGDLPTIQADPCITSFPLPPGGVTALPYVATSLDGSGDIPFINTGGFQGFFGGGAPTLKWFAPITFDSLGFDITGAPVAFYEDNGPCVDVNEDEVFAVVYLNAVDTSDVQITGCAGSFDLLGGLPEFDSNENYSISITLSTDPTVMATVINGNSASHGDNIDFSVAVAGTYDVVITDTKGCPLTFSVDMSGCSVLTMNVGNVTGTTASQVCVPITVEGFDNIASFQYTITWDPTIIDYVSSNSGAINTTNGDVIITQVGDVLTVSFFDFVNATGTTLPDGTMIFEICFNILGPVGSSSPINIDGSLTVIDVFNDANDPLALVVNSGSVTVVNQGAFDINVTPNDVSCFGLTDGSFDVVVNGTGGGVAPYTLDWVEIGTPTNNGSISSIQNNGMTSQSGLGAGTYAIVISDSSNPAMTDLDTIEIIEPLILGTNLTETQPTCFGDNNGSLTANVIVGSVIIPNPGPEYTFLWSPGGATTQTINNVNPLLGTYAVTITNGNMCTAVASLTPTQPAQLTVNVDVTDAACSGIDNGQIEATPMGGIGAAGYVYSWSTTPAQTTAIASNLGIGTYTVTVTDNNMCTATATTSVSAATIIFAGASVQDVTCNGLDNGAIFYNPQVVGVDNGGYTYQWTGGISTTSNASPIPPGTYTTTITDALGCNIDTTVVVSEPDPIEIVGMITTTDETCTVGSDGTASINVIGGTPSVNGYSYSWNCCVGQDMNSVTGIPAGNYIVTILDSLSCNTSAQFTINPPTPPTIVSFDSTSVNCPSDTDGSLTVNAMMGNAPITGYSWTYPNGTTNTGQTINNLGPGTYTVTVTAADGCVVVDSALLWAPSPLVLVQPIPTNPTCFGESTGTAAVQMSGGTMPYIYQWSANAGGSTDPVVPLLPAGTYTVTVTDANMCDDIITEVILVDPDSITVVIDNSTIMPAGCFGQTVNCNGGAIALASGGNAPSGIYTFSWVSSGEVTVGMSGAAGIGAASQLCAGLQEVVVIDENNCSSSTIVDIPEPPMLTLTTVLTEPTCNGDLDGSIEISPMGGTPGFSFEWAGGNMTNTLSNIPTGDYLVTITDLNGCELDTIINLGEPMELEASLDTLVNVSCSGDVDGVMSVTFIGGNGGPMTYDWAGGIAPTTSNTASNLAPGTYMVTVSDVNGCSDVVTANITEPIPVFAVIPTPVEPICFGDQTLLTVDTAFGGVGAPYTFTIDGGPAQNIGTSINVFAGNHTIVVSDGNGCTFEEDIFINQPPAIEVNLGPDVEIQLGESIQLNAVLSGSNVPIDSIIWLPSIFDSTSCTNCLSPIVSPIDNQLYTVEIFDINGCNGSDDILVEVDKNRNVYIPNVFTPNGDGFNDIFQVFSGPGVTQINSITVFDRWGEVVFQANNITPTPFEDFDNGWDGTFRTRVMNPGVFVYLVDVTFDDGVTLLFRGDVTLLH